jgi:hypothetical protein
MMMLECIEASGPPKHRHHREQPQALGPFEDVVCCSALQEVHGAYMYACQFMPFVQTLRASYSSCHASAGFRQ